VEETRGGERAKALFVSAPQATLTDEPIVAPEAEAVRPKRKRYRRRF
jgi:hypothetical protein